MSILSFLLYQFRRVKKLFILPFILVSCNLFSQQPGFLLNKTIGGSVPGIYYMTAPFSASKEADFKKTVEGLGYIAIINTEENDLDVSGHHGKSDVWVVRLDLNGNIVWQEALGGSDDDKFRRVIYLPDGSITIFGQTKSTDGDVIGNHGSQDIWIIKLSNVGTILWQKTLGGTLYEELRDADILSDGSYILTGYTASNNGDVSGNHGGDDIWLIKMLSDGTLQWKKCLGGTGLDRPKSVHLMSDGNIVVAGASSSADGDATVNHGNQDVWLIKLNSSGGIIWQRSYGGSNSDGAIKLVVSASGSLIVLANPSSNDGDLIGTHGSYEIWVLNIDYNNAGIIWQKCIGGTGLEVPFELLKMPDGSYTIASATTSTDFDAVTSHGSHDILIANVGATGVLQWAKCFGGSLPDYCDYASFGYDSIENSYFFADCTLSSDGDIQGKHRPLHPPYGNRDGWFFKLDINGNLLWQKCLGGTNYDIMLSASSIGHSQYALIGISYSKDGDLQSNIGRGQIWLSVLGPVNKIKGTEFADFNYNGIKDSNEPFADWLIQATKPGYIREARLLNGQFQMDVDSGTISSNVLIQNSYYNVVPVTHQSVFTGYNLVDSFSFALQPQPSKRDLAVSIIAISPARPGFNLPYRILYRNVGTDTVSTGTILFKKDSRLNFISSTPAVTSSSGDTLRWNYTNLKPFDSVSVIDVNLQVKAPPAININDTLYSLAIISPIEGDLTPFDDTALYKQRVVGSFDPNDKSENFEGIISQQQVINGAYITYLIRFQNTGTDTAFNISVRDTLDVKLDWNSFQMIETSHPYWLQTDGQNKLTWNFTDIRLVDSLHNKLASHGFIAFRIKPNLYLTNGDTIKNSASIYFDFNFPVKTNNTLTNVMGYDIKKCPQTNILIAALISGDSFQWQVDNGGGYVNISDNSNYQGSTNDTLQLILPPTSWYGNKYRCVINESGGISYSPAYTVKFQALWNGNSGHDWSDPSNWGCGVLPDEFTDVIIPINTINSPEVNSNASCRSLYIKSPSSIIVKPGFRLDIKGNN